MNLTRRDLAAAGVFALSTTTLILPAMAATDDEEAVKQAVEALRKAMLTQDKAKLETLTAEQLSYSHSDARLEDKAKFINAIMTRKAVLKSLDFPDLTVAIVGNNAIVRPVGVGKRTRRQSYQHQDRRPAGLAEAGQRLEVVSACVLHIAAADVDPRETVKLACGRLYRARPSGSGDRGGPAGGARLLVLLALALRVIWSRRAPAQDCTASRACSRSRFRGSDRGR